MKKLLVAALSMAVLSGCGVSPSAPGAAVGGLGAMSASGIKGQPTKEVHPNVLKVQEQFLALKTGMKPAFNVIYDGDTVDERRTRYIAYVGELETGFKAIQALCDEAPKPASNLKNVPTDLRYLNTMGKLIAQMLQNCATMRSEAAMLDVQKQDLAIEPELYNARAERWERGAMDTIYNFFKTSGK